MTFDIQEKARKAQASYQTALEQLNTARAAYAQGGGAAYAAAKAQHELLERKVKEAQEELSSASEAYHQALAADNFEKTALVREALARKREAEDMAEALRMAHAKSTQDMQRHLLEASVQGREYDNAHGSAYAAYVTAEAYTALAQHGEAVARALALSASVRADHGYYESDLGKPLSMLPNDLMKQAIRDRQAYIHGALSAMADEFMTRVDVAEIGVLDLGALQARELLSPAQIQKMKERAPAAQ